MLLYPLVLPNASSKSTNDPHNGKFNTFIVILNFLSYINESTVHGGFSGGSVVKKKKSACNAGGAGDAGLIPGLGRSPGEGHGNPLQYACLQNPLDRGTW